MGIISKATLTVNDAPRDGQYNDIVWLHYHYRKPPTPKDAKDAPPSVKVGTLINVSYLRNGKKISRVLSVRGVNDKQESELLIDHVNRNDMKLKVGDQHEFTFRTTYWWEKLAWVCSATDPGIRIASWIAIWFGILAVIGIMIALVGLYPVIKEIRADWNNPAPISGNHSPSTSVSSQPPQSAGAPPAVDHK